MPSNSPHQKFCFYHLPTRGRARIKLGDARYVSNVSIIFDCSMLYYLLFWTLLGFIIQFYIIFGTNLLTGGPTQNRCFLPVLGFRRKGISNGVQPEWNLRERDFRNEHDPEDLDPTSRNQAGSHEVGGAPTPQARPPISWAPRAATDVLLPPIYTYVPWKHPGAPRNTISTRSHLGSFAGTLPEGESTMEGFYINTIASPMKCE